MRRTGTQLEELVRQLETVLLPAGFSITPNVRIYSADGKQIAEFDIVIKGKIDDSDFCWLIECRDRPSDGPASGQWIEQLYGRRHRHKFNKVTAVSTTGFTADAADFAENEDIEIKSVRNIDFTEITNWFRIKNITQINRFNNLKSVKLYLEPSEAAEHIEAFKIAIAGLNGNSRIFKADGFEQTVTVNEIFTDALSKNRAWFDGIVPNETIKPIMVMLDFDDPSSRYSVHTALGDILIAKIFCKADLRIEEQKIGIAEINRYEKANNKEPIATSVRFSLMAYDKPYGINFVNVEETGVTHVTVSLRKEP